MRAGVYRRIERNSTQTHFELSESGSPVLIHKRAAAKQIAQHEINKFLERFLVLFLLFILRFFTVRLVID